MIQCDCCNFSFTNSSSLLFPSKCHYYR